MRSGGLKADEGLGSRGSRASWPERPKSLGAEISSLYTVTGDSGRR